MGQPRRRNRQEQEQEQEQEQQFQQEVQQQEVQQQEVQQHEASNGARDRDHDRDTMTAATPTSCPPLPSGGAEDGHCAAAAVAVFGRGDGNAAAAPVRLSRLEDDDLTRRGDDGGDCGDAVSSAPASAEGVGVGGCRSGHRDRGSGHQRRRHHPADILSAALVACACAWAIWALMVGLTLHRQFHNGDCCDMTYSGYKFIPIPFEDNYSSPCNATSRTSGSLLLAAGDHWESRGYRLWQFTDRRDPRHHHPGTTKQTKAKGDADGSGSSSTCAGRPRPPALVNPGHPVLYVPGHWGTHEQSRSLGAHGILLTEQRKLPRSLRERLSSLLPPPPAMSAGGSRSQHPGNGGGRMMSRLGSDEDFLYDVYALDFDGGEGSAFHAYRLWEQARAVNLAVRTILGRMEEAVGEDGDHDPDHCPPLLTIVGHSVGGVVARAAFVVPQLSSKTGGTSPLSDEESDQLRRSVKALVTLASPHATLPYALDSSVNDFYHKVNEFWRGGGGIISSSTGVPGATGEGKIDERAATVDDVLLVSLSGGARDELVPPETCDVDGIHSHGVSALASDVSTLKPAKDGHVAGMDHRSIVWCHNVLAVVRSLIDRLSKRDHLAKDVKSRADEARTILLMPAGGEAGAGAGATTTRESNSVVGKDHDGRSRGGGDFGGRVGGPRPLHEATSEHDRSLEESLGYPRKASLDAFSFTNINVFVVLYTVASIFRQLGVVQRFAGCAVPRELFWDLLTTVGAAVLSGWSSDRSVLVCGTLAIWAQMLHWFVFHVVLALSGTVGTYASSLGWRVERWRRAVCAIVSSVILCFVWSGRGSYLHCLPWNVACVRAVIFLALVLSMSLLALSLVFLQGRCDAARDVCQRRHQTSHLVRKCHRQVATLSIMLPALCVGKAMYAYSLLSRRGRSGTYAIYDQGFELQTFSFFVCLPIAWQLSIARRGGPFATLSCCWEYVFTWEQQDIFCMLADGSSAAGNRVTFRGVTKVFLGRVVCALQVLCFCATVVFCMRAFEPGGAHILAHMVSSVVFTQGLIGTCCLITKYSDAKRIAPDKTK